VVECLPSKCKTLSSNPSIAKNRIFLKWEQTSKSGLNNYLLKEV
jgi:hypothetical protein